MDIDTEHPEPSDGPEEPEHPAKNPKVSPSPTPSGPNAGPMPLPRRSFGLPKRRGSKQALKKSTGGRVPRKILASKAARIRRPNVIFRHR